MHGDIEAAVERRARKVVSLSDYAKKTEGRRTISTRSTCLSAVYISDLEVLFDYNDDLYRETHGWPRKRVPKEVVVVAAKRVLGGVQAELLQRQECPRSRPI
jgi:hypothetical protein